MKDIEKEVELLFNNMSDEEFDNMLKDAGFEIQKGNGEVVFKDSGMEVLQEENSSSINHKVKITFSTKQTTFTTKFKENGVKMNYFSFNTAC